MKTIQTESGIVIKHLEEDDSNSLGDHEECYDFGNDFGEFDDDGGDVAFFDDDHEFDDDDNEQWIENSK